MVHTPGLVGWAALPPLRGIEVPRSHCVAPKCLATTVALGSTVPPLWGLEVPCPHGGPLKCLAPTEGH